jgi:hypothetical protein
MLTRLLLAASCVLIGTSTPVTDQMSPGSPLISAPGRLVDLGGWRLHLNCTGEARTSQPAVILESGVGDFSVEWSLVSDVICGKG